MATIVYIAKGAKQQTHHQQFQDNSAVSDFSEVYR